MSRPFAKRIEAQLKKVIRDDNPYYTCCLDTDDVTLWYVLVANLPEPYIGGRYLFKIIIPDNFPDSPPSLVALTPNGLMELGGKICVSLGEFHSNDHYRTNNKGQYGWVPSLGISGFILQGVVNALLSFGDNEKGVRLNNQSNSIKNTLAKQSKEYNVTYNKGILDLFSIHQECFPHLEIFST